MSFYEAKPNEESGTHLLREVLNIVVKKIHWMDVDFQLLPLLLPAMDGQDLALPCPPDSLIDFQK